MATHRMIPPANGGSTTVNGRKYTCAAGTTIDVPDFDGSVLEANGWAIAAINGAGATAARPTAGVKVGSEFHDTTLGYNVMWNGKQWVNPTNGNAV